MYVLLLVVVLCAVVLALLGALSCKAEQRAIQARLKQQAMPLRTWHSYRK